MALISCIEEENGNQLQCSCLENPRDVGAWWAAFYGVAQSQTRLKRLSSSSNMALIWLLTAFLHISRFFFFFPVLLEVWYEVSSMGSFRSLSEA